MEYKSSFSILVLKNGSHVMQCLISPNTCAKLGIILGTFPNISELNWFKTEVVKAETLNSRTYTGLNTFECFVTGDICELGHEAVKTNFDVIPTNIVLDYIDKAIAFHEFYNSGKIPGIIPESHKEDWVIVPRNYVKQEFLNQV